MDSTDRLMALQTAAPQSTVLSLQMDEMEGHINGHRALMPGISAQAASQPAFTPCCTMLLTPSLHD